MSHPSVMVAPSVLMHTSLAYLLPESKCFDSIIRHHSRRTLLVRSSSSTSILSIPAELLLLVRSHLQSSLASHLLTRTDLALREYESSLRALLCPDCCLYNEDVFGSSVWSWEGFSGPCSCDLIGRERTRDSDQASLKTTHAFPKQFTDRQHWVEAYLSREYAHLSSNLTSPFGIWTAVDEVLRDFGCAVVRDHFSDPPSGRRQTMLMLLRNLGGPSYRPHRPKQLSIVPLPSPNPCASKWEGRRMEILLQRVRRELGLDDFFGNDADMISGEERTFTIRRRVATYRARENTHISSSSRQLLPGRASTALLRFVQAATACVMLPFAFIVTVLCFYCKPGSLRLL